MNRLTLGGCGPRPLGDYLKALGILRIVGAQVDSRAMGEWQGDRFVLTTTLNAEELVDFFADDYRPTPVVSPWNGGSGFSEKDQQAGIAAIEASTLPRFDAYRSAIAVARSLVARSDWATGRTPKEGQISRCRAALPDEAVEWLDAAVIMAGDRVVFPPIFGTGGNDGRLEFSNNFMQRLAEVLLDPPRRGAPDPKKWLRAALYGDPSVPLKKAGGGQYYPSSGGDDVTSSTGSGVALLNPWSYILMIEGGLLFASGAARRLGGGAAKAAMPFCVDVSTFGHGSSAVEEARGEIWAPLWRRPASLPEVARLFGEGRASWRGRDAGNGADFAKAAASLGVDRGIERFVRHGLLQRYGLSFMAVPLGEVNVGDRPEVRVLERVDSWLSRLPFKLPNAIASARRRLESYEYEVAVNTVGRARAEALQDVLGALAELEWLIGRSNRTKAECSPLGGRWLGLPASDWLPLLDDGTPELRLAVALASARDRFPADQLDDLSRTGSSMALYLRPIELDVHGNPAWRNSAPRVDGAGRRPLLTLIAEVLELRFRDLSERVEQGEPAVKGPTVAWDTGLAAPLTDLVALVEGRIDLDRLERLLMGMLMLDWRRRSIAEPAVRVNWPTSGSRRWVPPELSVLIPFFQRGAVVAPNGQEVWLRPRVDWARMLSSGKPEATRQVLDDAIRRLRISGCSPAATKARPATDELGTSLAAAVLVPVSASTAARLLQAVCPILDDRRQGSEDDQVQLEEEGTS